MNKRKVWVLALASVGILLTISLALTFDDLSTQVEVLEQRLQEAATREERTLEELEKTLEELDQAQKLGEELASRLSLAEAETERVKAELYEAMEELEEATLALECLAEKGGWRVQEGRVTAYSPFDNVSGIENDGDPTSTATGTYPQKGTIAVDPKRIPYGSEIIVIYQDGTIERGTALDTGGAMRRASDLLIDVYRDTYEEGSRHGVRRATIAWRPKD